MTKKIAFQWVLRNASIMPITVSGISAHATRNSTDRRQARNAIRLTSVIGGEAFASERRSSGSTSLGSIRSRNARLADSLRNRTNAEPGTSSIESPGERRAACSPGPWPPAHGGGAAPGCIGPPGYGPDVCGPEPAYGCGTPPDAGGIGPEPGYGCGTGADAACGTSPSGYGWVTGAECACGIG